MKWIGREKVGRLIIGNEWINKIYYGADLMWQAILSCFGLGYWRNDKAWLNNETWDND